ncbi:Bug family tripartite tricarboxylate transporter substrate binding protein [Bordetella sp. 02P26C-1]|uniref:Bug family tripartite tricarboxylate transporter substrate binding protein n=1 Tax=Bordetella sp. 02P26C-1 TaxID=2683195 RepID=UPI001365EF87|nr:tripartite tricarboxylate transporter substrate binding protein [Bordetella sp. 02P26C-1]
MIRKGAYIYGSLLLTMITSIVPVVQAKEFPSQPIRFIVSFAPGGGSDTIARLLAKPLGEIFGQTVVVENKPGAYGSVAASQLTQSAPDGYTLALVTNSTISGPAALGVKLPYKIPQDFTPITLVAFTPIVLAVHPSLKVDSYAEFVELLKRSPKDGHFYGTYGFGSGAHFAGEYMKSHSDVPMTQVPYKGSGPLANALIAGEVKIGLMELSTAAPFIQSGQIRALVVTSPERSPNFPDVPTLSEVGFPTDLPGWYGVVGPKNLPPRVVGTLNEKFQQALNLQDVQQKFSSMGLIPASSTSAEFENFIDSDIATWKSIAKRSNIEAD